MSFIEILWRQRPIKIEYQWVGVTSKEAPVLVFLHEGLGSVAMWRDFPEALATHLGMRGLVYSRPGYGASSPKGRDEEWGLDFLHQQAQEVFPEVLLALNIHQQVDILGHSDGGSIALLIAALKPNLVKNLILMSPHIYVEEITAENIYKAKVAYEQGDLKPKLSKFHEDVDSAFYAWNDIWLKPEFMQWNIEKELALIHCPILAMQGQEDPYGSMSQIKDIAKYVSQIKLVEIPSCGHSPHRDSPIIARDTIFNFIKQSPENNPKNFK
jgi:pimeloyl-ACP methyl ester carboxylesterase